MLALVKGEEGLAYDFVERLESVNSSSTPACMPPQALNTTLAGIASSVLRKQGSSGCWGVLSFRI